MSNPADRIRDEALRLSIRDRAQLARRLIESLDESAGADPAEVELAWESEIERRLLEYRAGRTKATPAPAVIKEARARFGNRE